MKSGINKQKARRSRAKESSYKKQFLRTERNKFNQAVARKRRAQRWK